MRTRPGTDRAALRRAAWASVALHLAAAALVGLFVRSGAPPAAARHAPIDTRAPDLAVRFADEPATVELSVPSAPPAPAVPDAPPRHDPPARPTPEPAPTEPSPAGPFAPRPPQTLPPDVLALVRRPGAVADPHVRPAGGAAAVGPLHGPLRPGLTVVYALDASGSMGAGGKFDAARAALAATLAAQPPEVRFQVLVYDGSARPLLQSAGTAVPATAANVREAAARLAALAPRGRSNHLAAARAALDFRPDVLILLTDADDLTAAALRPALTGTARPPAVWVVPVTAAGAGPARELK